MNGDADAKRRGAIASKLVVSKCLTRLMGFLGYAGLPGDMKTALAAADVSRPRETPNRRLNRANSPASPAGRPYTPTENDVSCPWEPRGI